VKEEKGRKGAELKIVSRKEGGVACLGKEKSAMEESLKEGEEKKRFFIGRGGTGPK